MTRTTPDPSRWTKTTEGDLVSRVLVAEDEAVLAEALAAGLRRRGHVVSVAFDGAEARQLVNETDFDVLLLDRTLPYVSGDEICEELHVAGSGARVIMVTAASEVAERVHGLEMGADDYLTKPFAFEELAARVEALSRRPSQRRGVSAVVVADVAIDPARRAVRRAGRPVELTVKEFDVLTVLAAQPDCWFSTEALLDQVWDENTDPFTSAVKVTMWGLRRKLGEPPMIETLRGVGYRLCSEGISA